MLKELNRAQRYARARVKFFYPPEPASLTTSWVITVHSATQEPERWLEHKLAADQSYKKRNIQAVGRHRGIDTERYPTYFAEARLASGSEAGKLIGGIRIHCSDQNAALPLYEEITNYTNISSLTTFFDANEPSVYGAGLWTVKGSNYPGLGSDLAKASHVIFYASPAKWLITCTPHYIKDAWASLGFSLWPQITPFPYPDERYQSCVLVGSESGWPVPFKRWVVEQAEGFALDDIGMPHIIQPMRLAETIEKLKVVDGGKSNHPQAKRKRAVKADALKKRSAL